MKECFFYIEPDANGEDDEGMIHALCVPCRMNNLEKFFDSWFYTGQFGPWTVSCHSCNKVIHEHEGGDEISSEKT